MARERRSRRGEAEELAVVSEGASEGGRGRGERPSTGNKVPQGPSFAMTVGFASGAAAAILAFLGAFFVGAASTVDPGESVDLGGVQAARMLAAPGIERWRAGFGTTAVVRLRVKEYLDKKLNDTKDAREKTAYSGYIDDFKMGKNATGMDWRPGLDLAIPPNDPVDDQIELARKQALARAVGQVPGGLLGAAVFDGSSVAVSCGEGIRAPAGTPKQVGDTKVYNFGVSRQYEHPVVNRDGKPEGRAVVAISTAGLKGSSPVASAGVAALAALIGGFAVGFVMALGPVKAIRKLATDAGAIADGKLDTRVSLQGPDVVQAAAKNVQRMAQMTVAAASVAQAEPQVIQQQVIVQPVAEIQEGLAPLKSFRRPDEFEIEATQKPCPDVGNDYYDLVNVDDEHVGVFVADIPNMRGVRGAMYMAQVRAIFRSACPGQQSPAEVLKVVNRAFAADVPRGVYVTASYAIVNRTTGACRVASAQHLPLVFWKLAKKASARVTPEGIALGLDPGPVFDKTIGDKQFQLERGDRIVLYTDGAITAKNPAGAQYGEERFYYVVNREAPKNSAACVNFVANDVDLFHEGAPQMDDFTIVTLRKLK
jgi:serine phosphatase RsbU (regulator of sigma subunit)